MLSINIFGIQLFMFYCFFIQGYFSEVHVKCMLMDQYIIFFNMYSFFQMNLLSFASMVPVKNFDR